MNDCPRRYTQKKAAYRSVSPGLRKKPLRRVFAFGGAENRFGGFLLLEGQKDE
ncbi:hypothetical protein GNZ05_17505 [Escherichia coli]|uniref:Uncharacterized protein n=1 Tax=Escherichia coli TaxID=562 RepID=A0AAJ3CZ54_ECOLX|nr:hypothetical protein [Escherichia coli]MUM73943.1 hypothetical protein [Escherichia coli]